MKRAGNLFEAILDRENLRRAVHKAMKGKRAREDARIWVADLDANLERIARQLRAAAFPVGRFHQFTIHDPKERIITAPCFEERVVHHAIMNVCEPHLDRWLIPDTYACRVGKGRIRCLLRARQYAARHGWFLKMDIRKYFDSVSHDRLLDRWAMRFKDRQLFQLLESIIRGYRGDTRRGLPIGSLTSQHLANFYLGWFDRFLKERLRMPGYVRYMDDMAIWANDPAALENAQREAHKFLGEKLDLEVKPEPYWNRTAHGMDFLGCRVFHNRATLNRRSRLRFRRRWHDLLMQYDGGQIGETELQARGTALIAFTQTAGLSAWRFRRDVVNSAAVSGQEVRTA